MDTTTDFGFSSINLAVNLQWVFMVEWIIGLIGSIGILFYFNRLMGSIISFILKYLIWKRYKVRIKVQSYKISFLGGRLFFKNVTIITQNEMILIHQGWLTWRYWLTTVRQSGFITTDKPNKNESLPSRFLMEIYGLELFVYNRMHVYENLMTKLQEEDLKSPEMHLFNPSKSSEDTTEDNTVHEKDPTTERQKIPFIIKLLPLKILVKRGSFVVGNETTTSLLVGSYTSFEGTLDFLQPTSKLDFYRVDHELRLWQLQLFLKPNVSYQSLGQRSDDFDRINKHKIQKFIDNLKLKFHKQKETDVPETRAEWHGLERYRTSKSFEVSSQDTSDDLSDLPQDDALIFPKSDYARYTHIFDSEYVDLHYFFDMLGTTPNVPSQFPNLEGPDIGNGDLPPANNIDISVSGGVVHFGPWADKERVLLQQMLFPSICRDAEPFKQLKPGSKRQYIGFKTYITTVDEMVVRIPFREASKDILYVDSKDSENQLERRPFGWLELKADQDTSFNSFTSYIPTAEDGWNNSFHLDLQNPTVSSSVNHNIFFRALNHTIDGDIGYPLQWNGATTWKFENISTNAEIYILREHITLLTDMFADFSSGEPTPYELFRPFLYRINWRTNNYNIFLNLNEKNIVSHPLDFNDNIFVSFSGSQLDLNVDIPLDSIYQKSTVFEYKLNTTFDLVVHLPPWHTGYNFLRKKEVGRANNYEMSGSFTFFNSLDIDAIDTIIVNCTCEDTTLECYGFIIRYVLLLKANYFGEDIEFQTLAEFLEDFNDKSAIKNKEDIFNPFAVKMRNETDLLFSFCVKNGCLILPSHIYDCESHVALQFEKLDIDLRFNNYYMDLQADFSEIYAHAVDNADEESIFDKVVNNEKTDYSLFIDHLPVHGHRVFGLPPDEPTYFCRWEFDPGRIVLDSKPDFLDDLLRALSAIGVGYNELENSLGLPEEVLFDVLNLFFSCPEILVKINGPNYDFSVTLMALSLTISDQAADTYNSRINLKIEDIMVQSTKDKETVLELKTSLYLSDFIKKPDFATRKAAQKEHLKTNDAPFHRCPFLLDPSYRDSEYLKLYGSMRPFINYPDVPPPLNFNSADVLIEGYPKRLRESLHYRPQTGSFSSSQNDLHSSINYRTDSAILEDDGFEHDNIVCTFGKLNGYVSPKVAQVLGRIAVEKNKFSVTNILDEIQKDFIAYLTKRNSSPSQKVDLKALIPQVNLKISDSRESPNGIVVGVAKVVVTGRIQDEEPDIFELDLSQILVSILKGDTSMCDLELIKFEAEIVDCKSFTNIVLEQERCNFNVNPESFDWISDYISALVAPIESAKIDFESAKLSVKQAKIDVVHAVSSAGVDYSIRQDPSCITKPSYVSKFCDEHIRLEDSWKIITRLRHILYNLPDNWHEDAQQRYDQRIWDTPANADQKVYDVFLNWRRWEFSNISTSYVLRDVFGSTEIPEDAKSISVVAKLKTTNLTMQPFSKLVVLKDVDFIFDQNKLTDDLRELANTISGTDVEDGVNVNLSIGLFQTDLDRISNSIPYINDLVTNITSKTPSSSTKTTNGSPTISKPQYFSANVMIKEFRHHLSIQRSAIDVHGTNTVLELSGVNTPSNIMFTFLLNNESFTAETFVDKIRLFQFICVENSFVVASSPASEKSQVFVDVSTSDVSFIAGLGSESYLQAIDIFMDEEFKVLEPLIANFKQIQHVKEASKVSAREQSSPDFLKHLESNITANVLIAKFSLYLEVLTPFLYKMEMYDLILDLSASKSGATSNFSILRLSSGIFSTSQLHQVQYVGIMVRKLKAFTTLLEKSGRFDIFSQIHADQLRLTSSQNNAIYLAKLAETDYGISVGFVELFRTRFAEISSIFKGSDSEPVTSVPPILKFNIGVSLDTLGLTCLLNKNQTHVDSNHIAMKFISSGFNYTETRPQGFLKVPSTKLSIFSHGPQTSRFVVCDFNLELKGLQSISTEKKLHEIDLTSEYCRFVLDPYFTKELIEIFSEFKAYKKPSTQTSKPEVDVEELWNLLSVYSIRVVSKHLCIGWLLPKSNRELSDFSSNIPGFIVGYENAEILCSTKSGNVLVSSMYLATAHGDTSTTFFSKGNEHLSENRAFFPRFELNFGIFNSEEGRDIRAQLDGDKVDFKLQTTILSVADRLARSIVTVQEKLELLKTPQVVQPRPTDESATFFSSIQSKLKLLECLFTFNGASIMIIDPNLEVNHKPASLSLQAPSVQIATEYIKVPESSKRHVISVQAHTSSTDNVLYASSVPVIVSLVNNIRDLVKNNEMTKKKTQTSKAPLERRRNSVLEREQAALNFERMFEHFKLNLSLKVEPQKLTLSCDPNAKVEAAVSTSGIYWHFITDTDTICTTILVEKLKAKLQHVYSKETSGSVGANNIILTGTIGKTEGVKLMSNIAEVSSIDAYLNIQQRQDVDIFRDIWIPEELYKSSVTAKEDREEELSFQSIASRVKDVSSTTTLPWILTLLVGELKLKVDLGFSLGTLDIEVNKSWLKSTKNSNSDHNLRLEIGLLKIFSEGRLGGLLVVENARMVSAISWTKEEGMPGIPLVLLSAGFKSLETKISLDYHTFFIGNITKAMASIYNQGVDNNSDKLVGKASVETFNVYMTALAASNFVDIYTIGLRIRQDIKVSYHQTLNDALVDQSQLMNKSLPSTQSEAPFPVSRLDTSSSSAIKTVEMFLDVIEEFYTDLDIKIGSMQIQIFPSTLLDTQALTIRIGKSSANFVQIKTSILENKLDMSLDNVTVSLSTFKSKPTKQSLQEVGIHEYVKLANTASGGGIFVFPSLKVSMDVFQKPDSNLIEFLFSSSFGGSVDLRWKLGSVYFIREMWYSHATTLKTRLTALRIFTSGYNFDTDDILEENYKESIFEAVNLEDKLKDVESDKKYHYVPLEEPHIETPRLRDLGTATPPLEWFGLHRNNFPNLTHQFVIVGLQKIVKEAENRYANVLK
ncbi:hypothetical protein OGAPHI_002261 [Ogataea philodendri]|uniref:Protein CSF1 n=1 Tax=Ogataea philodendri TaxID=1378263 RepID=A0A9P8PAP0_9ASCO|nr:uncharacterized protein OGAPHI_002261 [Ogataea philodendri]KAH3668507.1 hypothetical protein OGAPHI_002261 [Ogataea philodendri]